MTQTLLWRLPIAALLVLAGLSVLSFSRAAIAQEASPAAYSCETVATPMAGMDHSTMAGMQTGTPAATAEFDQLYIDMMIPHHAGIVALSQAALPRLQDERLVALAEAVVADQTAEIDELRGYREQWYGSAESLPLDSHTMMQVMPGMAMPLDQMMAQMDPRTQVALFCAAPDPDLAFIDLVIPHHQSAIIASEAALERASHLEIREIAQRVIDAQQREIAELSGIRLEVYGSATPEPVGT